MSKRIVLAAALLVLGAIASVRANSIAIGNASFETPFLADNTFVYDPVAVWTFSPALTGGIQNMSDTPGVQYSATGLAQIDGRNVAFSNGGTISQVLAATLAPNQLYTLSALVGDRTDVNNAGTNWAIRLYAGSTLLAQRTKADNSPPVPDGAFATESVSYNSPSSGPLLGQALKVELYSSALQYDFDKVSLNVVPTPTAALGGFAIMGMLLGWRKFKAAHD